MKEALVELAITLVRNNLDPRTYQFFTSQPLQGHFPYQVEILTDLVETMKTMPTTLPRVSVASSHMTSSSPITGVTSRMSTQAPCSNVVFSPSYPPPTTSKHTGIDASQGLDNQVLKKLLTSVEKIQEVLEKTMHSAGYGGSEFESFTTAAMSSSSKCSSLSTEVNPFLYSSTDYGSQASSLSTSSGTDMSSICRPGKPWTKSQL